MIPARNPIRIVPRMAVKGPVVGIINLIVQPNIGKTKMVPAVEMAEAEVQDGAMQKAPRVPRVVRIAVIATKRIWQQRDTIKRRMPIIIGVENHPTTRRIKIPTTRYVVVNLVTGVILPAG